MTFRRRLYHGAEALLGSMSSGVSRPLVAAVSRLPIAAVPPRFIAVEPTNHCNLRCPLCPVGAGVMTRARGFMDVDRFRGLVDEIAPFTRRMLMNFAGEPLLHPRIGDLVSHAEDAGIRITLGTHGNIDKMSEIVDARLSEILFSLDGASEDIYRQYRLGGSCEVALANLGKLIEERDRAGTGLPRIVLQFVVMRHNEHQVQDVLALGSRLGVDEISLQPVCVNDFFPATQSDLMREWVPVESPHVLHPGLLGGRPPKRPVLCIWSLQSVVLYNGDVTVCCFDANGSEVVGNAFGDGGFLRVWRSAEYRRARQKVVTQDLELCRHCDISVARPVRIEVADKKSS